MSRRGAGIAGNSAIATAPSNGPSTGVGSSNLIVPGAALAGGKPVNPGAPSWANVYGGMGLARPPEDFTHAAFGPMTPILSMPINEPNPGTGQPEARREQYPITWNLPVGVPGTEGLKLADFQTLQTLSNLYSVARACIEYLKREITSLEWDILPTQDAAKAMRNDTAALKDFGDRRAQAIKFLRRPDPDYFSWQTWLSVVLEEILVYDALSIVLRPKWGKGMGKGILGSDLDCLNIINGPTIRPLYDVWGATPRPPAVAYQQYLYGVPRVDLGTMLTDRDVGMGALRGYEAQAYMGSQLIYLPMVPRRWTPYGFPPIERTLIPIISGLSKQTFALDFFREGTVPAVYISPGGDLSPNQVRELQDALNAVAGDPAFHHKIIVLPSGSQVLPQRDAQLADQFDEIIMTQTCMGFGVQPMQVGIMPRASSSSSPGAANQMAKQSSNVQDQSTLRPHTIFLSVLIERILSDVCGQNDMRFVFDGMEEEEDQETLTNLVVNQWSHGLLTTDEGRDALGYQPFGLPETGVPVVLTATGVMPLTTSIQQAQATADAATQAAQNPPPAPGMPVNNEGQLSDAQHGGTNTPPKTGNGKPAPTAKKPQSATGGKQTAAQSANDTSNAMSEGSHAAAKDGSGVSGTGKSATVTDTAPAEQDTQEQPQPPSGHPVTEAVVAAMIIKAMMGHFLDLYAGKTTVIQALQAVSTALHNGYLTMMTAASKAAVAAGDAAEPLSADVLHGLAAARAATQQPYLLGLAQDVQAASTNATDLGFLPARTKLYSEGLHGAGQEAYGKTALAATPKNGLIWRLGETEHCPLCLARDGQVFTLKTMPGWPGDGGFGGPLCLGGPNCGCHYDYVENGKVLEQGFNTQRPESVGYYAQQLSDIQALRAQMHQAKLDFIAGLPNKIGADGTSAQMRAMARYQLQRRLSQLANQRIQSSGGYGGVSVEPSDIPASIIASLLPPGSEANLNVPLPDLMNAIDQMFQGKFSTLDITKGVFTQAVMGAVTTIVDEDRRASAELDACARHLIKGRQPLEWRCEKVGVLDVKHLDQRLRDGMTRGQAVADVMRQRRYVSIDGQVVEPKPTQADREAAALPDAGGDPNPRWFGGGAAGAGAGTPVPHDANGVFHDLSDLKPRPNVAKNAADLHDPNPVEAEHVLNLMRGKFPEKALGWVDDATWVGPVKVPVDRFDTDDQDSWSASHHDSVIKDYQKQIKDGTAHLNPIIGVQVPGDDRVKIVDGHHRFLAYQALGKKVPAYIGTISNGDDSWEETHSSQVMDTANKVADTPDKEQDTERLRHYWSHGEGAIKVRWGEPGDFDRCVSHVGKFMDNPKGYCAERHHDALGIWPATHAKEVRDGGKNAAPVLGKAARQHAATSVAAFGADGGQVRRVSSPAAVDSVDAEFGWLVEKVRDPRFADTDGVWGVRRAISDARDGASLIITDSLDTGVSGALSYTWSTTADGGPALVIKNLGSVGTVAGTGSKLVTTAAKIAAERNASILVDAPGRMAAFYRKLGIEETTRP